MKRLFDAADRWIRAADWRDIALVKICVCALGVLVGLAVPGRKKRVVAWVAALALAATYVPLMGKFLPLLLGRQARKEDDAC